MSGWDVRERDLRGPDRDVRARIDPHVTSPLPRTFPSGAPFAPLGPEKRTQGREDRHESNPRDHLAPDPRRDGRLQRKYRLLSSQDQKSTLALLGLDLYIHSGRQIQLHQ